MPSNRLHRWAPCLLALALVAQGCAFFAGNKPPVAGDDIKIGFVGSFSGSNAGNGQTVLQGVQMAQTLINGGGGVLGGRKLQILTGDDESDPNTAAKVASNQIAQGAVALIGPNASGIGKVMLLQAAKPNGVAMISPSATSPDFADPTVIDNGGYFFRTVPSDKLQGQLISQRAVAKGYKNLAVIHMDNPYGDALSKVIEDSFKASGTTSDFKYPEISDPQDQAKYDFASIVKNALDTSPDAIILIAYPGDGSFIINDWQTSGRSPNLPWIFTDSLDRQDFANNVTNKAVLENFYGTAPATDPTFVSRFKSQFSADPGFDAGAAYDALCLIALAIEEAKTATPGPIRDHLRSVSGPDGDKVTPDTIVDGLSKVRAGTKVNYDGWEGPVDLDEHGDVTSGKYVIWHITGGKVGDTSEIVSL